MIQLHHRAEHLVASLADVPPMTMGHLHNQPPHVQPLQHPTDRMALTAAIVAILGVC